jgi:RND family efflux transporter MFP subunit
MSDAKASLDALRIDRARPPARRGFGLLIGVIVIIALLGAGGAAAYVWWPAAGVPVQSVTAEANAAAASGAGLDATGYVVARRQATISAKIAGKLVEANLEEGEHVAAGQIVARLDDSNYKSALDVAVANEKMAETMLADSEPTYHRYQQLRAQNAVSEDSVQTQKTLFDTSRMSLSVAKAAVMQAQTNENDTVVRAPFDGIVTAKVAQAGEFVAPAAGGGGGGALTGIATIVDMNSLEVQVDVSENYIERVHAGGQATIVLDAYPEWEIPANVIAVIPTADQTKGTVKVRVAIKAKDARILPQMGARVTFLTDAQAPSAPASRGVTVPLTAVRAQGRTGSVFVIGEDNIVRMRPVTLGLKTAQTVTVLSGVAPGDRLAVGDFAKLHDGVKVAIQQ